MKRSEAFLHAMGWMSILTMSGCSQHKNDTDNAPVKSKYVHQYGVEVDTSDDWKERGASGNIEKKLKSGVCISESWKNGMKDGIWTYSFPHSNQVRKKEFYEKDGLLWTMYHFPSGIPYKQEMNYPGNVVMVSTWYEDGTPRSKEEYFDSVLISGEYFSPKQEVEAEVHGSGGIRVCRDQHGQLLSKEIIKDGVKETEEQFHINGMPKSYIPFSNGQVHGIKRTFYPNGEPKTVETWENGELNGTLVIFQNAEKVREVPYVRNQKNGIEKRFSEPSDIVVEEISWKDDKRHGKSFVVIDDRVIEEWYFDGKKVSRSQFLEMDRVS